MKFNLQTLRRRLNENKIFFEVIVASLLSFMAIYVSIQANRIAETQTRIMREENLPELEIRQTQQFNPKIKIYDNTIWFFFNRGGQLTNFHTEDYTFFRFVYDKSYDSLQIPLHNYLGMQGELTGDSEGLVYQVDNNFQGVKEVELRDSLSNLGYYEIDTYIKITYDDIFSEHHDEYYQIQPFIKKISRSKWDEVEARHINSRDRIIFSGVSAKDIIDKKVHF